MTIAQILSKMIAASNGNIHDIDHLLRVWAYARTIGELEGLDAETQYLLEVAAITHDIACPLCREKYGNTNGKYQEQEGAVLVRSFLADTGMTEAQIARVAYLVGHHHTLRNIHGPDYQILIEADYIANASENGYGKQSVVHFLNTIMKTASGKHLAASVLGISASNLGCAVKEALDARGHETSFLDMLHMFGAPGPLSFDKILNRISTKAPDVFGMMYHAGAMYSATGVTSPVYMANIRHARQLNAFIRDNGYDAVVCSHLFPMETLTFLRRWERCEVKCCGILSDYTCIPFLAETDLDAYFLPHSEVRELCIQAGMPAEKLIVSSMPVAARFLAPMDKAAARAALGLPADKKIYLIMTGGIGCGDAVSLCDAIRRVPDENALLCVLPGRNEALRQALEDAYHGQGVLTVPFTDQVPAYMHAADVLLSKAGGISSSEAAMLGVPLVHTMAIPGVETENAAFFARHGLSFFARSVDEAARFADRLIYDPACAERMLAAQAAWLPRNGAEQIAAAVTAQ